MKTLGLLKEPDYEHRICLLPKEAQRLIEEFKTTILFEAGFGAHIGIPDEAYLEVGAQKETAQNIFSNSDIILSINHLYNGQNINPETSFIGIYNLLYFPDRLDNYAKNKATVYSLELLPRSTTAQRMDVLSSMASLSGYKAVIKASEMHNSALPMFTTAAGTLKPAKVLVLGAGVAGLQAIATAKRLGAVVEAFDVRSSAAEEVKSLGANFIEVPGYKESKSAGGYAVTQTEEYLKKQKQLIHKHIEAASIVISTANIPGKKAPLLVEQTAVDGMKPGAVIIDLAAEQGGNCELTINEQIKNYNGVIIYGNSHLSRELPQAASQLLSNNYFAFLKHLLTTKNPEDELLKGCKALQGGNPVHPAFIEKQEKI